MIKFDKNEFLKPQIYSTNDEYETRCNVTKEIVNDIKQLQQENQELKKQLENKNKQIEYLRRSIERKEDTIIDLQNETIPYTNEYVCKLETQQKEFIEYLESEIKYLKIVPLGCKTGYLDGKEHSYIEILSKYKEITGDDK